MDTLRFQPTVRVPWRDKSRPSSSQTTQSLSWLVRAAPFTVCLHPLIGIIYFPVSKTPLSSQTLGFRVTSWLPWSLVNTRPHLHSREVWLRSTGSLKSSPFASAAWSTSISWSSPRSTTRSFRTSSHPRRAWAPTRKEDRGGERSVVLLIPFLSNGLKKRVEEDDL